MAAGGGGGRGTPAVPSRMLWVRNTKLVIMSRRPTNARPTVPRRTLPICHFPPLRWSALVGFGRHRRAGSAGSRRRRSAPTERCRRIEPWHAVDVRCRRSCGSWDPVLGRAKATSSSAEPDDDEVECMGESTRAEAEAARVVAGRDVAVDLDAEDEE